MSTTTRMPVGFVGHGNPMNALGGPLAEAWGRWGESLPTPTGVLVISAHFEAAPPTLSSVTGSAQTSSNCRNNVLPIACGHSCSQPGASMRNRRMASS